MCDKDDKKYNKSDAIQDCATATFYTAQLFVFVRATFDVVIGYLPPTKGACSANLPCGVRGKVCGKKCGEQSGTSEERLTLSPHPTPRTSSETRISDVPMKGIDVLACPSGRLLNRMSAVCALFVPEREPDISVRPPIPDILPATRTRWYHLSTAGVYSKQKSQLTLRHLSLPWSSLSAKGCMPWCC